MPECIVYDIGDGADGGGYTSVHVCFGGRVKNRQIFLIRKALEKCIQLFPP